MENHRVMHDAPPSREKMNGTAEPVNVPTVLPMVSSWINDETKYGNHNDDDRLVQLLEATEQYNRHNRNQCNWKVHIERFTMTNTRQSGHQLLACSPGVNVTVRNTPFKPRVP